MKIRRAIAFARHVPPGQMARRVYLTAKRWLLDRGGRRPLKSWRGLAPVAVRVLGLCAPHGSIWREDGGWRGRFLNDEHELGSQNIWVDTEGDARAQLWRMNLHYFEFLPEIPDEDLVALIDGWIRDCRPRTRVASSAAWTPYAISLRMSAWLDAWSTRGPFGDEGFVGRFSASLAEQADYLCANLETDVRGNHLIKNIRALTEAAAALGTSGRRWSSLADRHLRRELARQVLPDGVHYERTPSYHNQVFADLMMIAANRPQDDALGLSLANALRRMAQASADLTHPDGGPAQFGDSGLTMTVSTASCLRAYEALFGQRPLPQSRFSYQDGGFHGARKDGDYLIVRMGKLGPDALMAHAHGDWGSFEWSIDGHRVIVDQGVYKYAPSDERRVARSTLSHNTATLDGAEQADFFGAFRCGARPDPEAVQYEATAGGFRLTGILAPALHPSGGRQRRSISLTGRSLHIEDEALGGQALAARALIGPSIAVESRGNGIRLTLPNGALVTVTSEDARIQLEETCLWPDMGRTGMTQRLVASRHGKIGMTFRGE